MKAPVTISSKISVYPDINNISNEPLVMDAAETRRNCPLRNRRRPLTSRTKFIHPLLRYQKKIRVFVDTIIPFYCYGKKELNYKAKIEELPMSLHSISSTNFIDNSGHSNSHPTYNIIDNFGHSNSNSDHISNSTSNSIDNSSHISYSSVNFIHNSGNSNSSANFIDNSDSYSELPSSYDNNSNSSKNCNRFMSSRDLFSTSSASSCVLSSGGFSSASKIKGINDFSPQSSPKFQNKISRRCQLSASANFHDTKKMAVLVASILTQEPEDFQCNITEILDYYFPFKPSKKITSTTNSTMTTITSTKSPVLLAEENILKSLSRKSLDKSFSRNFIPSSSREGMWHSCRDKFIQDSKQTLNPSAKTNSESKIPGVSFYSDLVLAFMSYLEEHHPEDDFKATLQRARTLAQAMYHAQRRLFLSLDYTSFVIVMYNDPMSVFTWLGATTDLKCLHQKKDTTSSTEDKKSTTTVVLRQLVPLAYPCFYPILPTEYQHPYNCILQQRSYYPSGSLTRVFCDQCNLIKNLEKFNNGILDHHGFDFKDETFYRLIDFLTRSYLSFDFLRCIHGFFTNNKFCLRTEMCLTVIQSLIQECAHHIGEVHLHSIMMKVAHKLEATQLIIPAHVNESMMAPFYITDLSMNFFPVLNQLKMSKTLSSSSYFSSSSSSSNSSISIEERLLLFQKIGPPFTPKILGCLNNYNNKNKNKSNNTIVNTNLSYYLLTPVPQTMVVEVILNDSNTETTTTISNNITGNNITGELEPLFYTASSTKISSNNNSSKNDIIGSKDSRNDNSKNSDKNECTDNGRSSIENDVTKQAEQQQRQEQHEGAGKSSSTTGTSYSLQSPELLVTPRHNHYPYHSHPHYLHLEESSKLPPPPMVSC